MEIYLPPIFTLLLGIIAIGMIYVLRVPILVIAVLSLILVSYTLYIHLGLFTNEYRASYLGDALKSSAPVIMVSAIIIASVIYLLISRSKSSTSSPLRTTSWFSRTDSKGQTKSSWFNSAATTTQPKSWFGSFGMSSRDKRQDYISALDRAI